MATLDIATLTVLSKPDRVTKTTRPPMVAGGTFQGTGAQLTIWANEYNARIKAKATPRHAAAHAARTMLTTCSMHDLGQLGYYAALENDPGSPSSFSFQPGQLFPQPTSGPIPPAVFTGLQLAISIISYIPAEWAQVLDLVLELLELVLDIVNYIFSLFAGKPTYLDTQLVANRFLSGANPASFVPGIQLTRNLSQNSIYLSSSDPADQEILGNIRRQAEEMLVAQGQTQANAKQLITLVWDSANNPDFNLPDILKKPPPPQNPPPPPPPTCPPGSHWDPITMQCVPDTTPPPPPPNQGPCPPYTSMPACLPNAPASDPSNDEIGDLAQQGAYWLMIIAVYMMNMYQALSTLELPSGQGGNSDPVTCTQLTAQVELVNQELSAIATAITNLVQPGAPPLDLTPIVEQLNAIALAIASRPVPLPPPPPPSDPSVSEMIQTMANEGFFAPDVSQDVVS